MCLCVLLYIQTQEQVSKRPREESHGHRTEPEEDRQRHCLVTGGRGQGGPEGEDRGGIKGTICVNYCMCSSVEDWYIPVPHTFTTFL